MEYVCEFRWDIFWLPLKEIVTAFTSIIWTSIYLFVALTSFLSISPHFSWFSMTFHDFSRFSVISQEFSWFFTIFWDFSCVFTVFRDFSRFSVISHDFPWFFTIFRDFPVSFFSSSFTMFRRIFLKQFSKSQYALMSAQNWMGILSICIEQLPD